MYSTIWQITKNTFRETIRQPIYLLLLLTSLVLIGISPFAAMFTFDKEVKLVTDMAMATTLLFGWITAVLGASHAISREIDTGTALMVLSKPVNRVSFIFAKICGILLALAIFCYLNSIASLLALRMLSGRELHLDNVVVMLFFGAIGVSCLIGAIRNYRSNSSFTMVSVLSMTGILTIALGITTLISLVPRAPAMKWEVVPALILVVFAVWAMGSLATALSTRLAVAGNLIICFLVFMCGLMSDYIFGRFAESSVIADIAYAAVPNWQLFWMADALAAGKEVPAVYVLLAAGYIGLFVALFALLGVLLFLDREVGQQRLS